MALYLPSHEVVLVYTHEVISARIREETIKKYDLIDRSGQLDTRKFKNRHGNSEGYHFANNSVMT